MADMTWQPISKRAAESEDSSGAVPGYLCLLDRKSIDESCFRYMVGNGVWLNANGKKFGVTHWMPLPKPPQ